MFLTVIPAQAGTHLGPSRRRARQFWRYALEMGPRFRGDDEFWK